MSADSSWDVQTGVFTHLTAAGALTALLADGAGSILDHVPAGTAFPYLVIGETSARPLDGHAASGNEIMLTLHTYSRASGMQQARSIMAAVYTALHEADFTVPNQALALCRCIGSEAALEADGLTRHGIQHFRIITEPV